MRQQSTRTITWIRCEQVWLVVWLSTLNKPMACAVGYRRSLHGKNVQVFYHLYF